jgi:hypothetical protein
LVRKGYKYKQALKVVTFRTDRHRYPAWSLGRYRLQGSLLAAYIEYILNNAFFIFVSNHKMFIKLHPAGGILCLFCKGKRFIGAPRYSRFLTHNQQGYEDLIDIGLQIEMGLLYTV